MERQLIALIGVSAAIYGIVSGANVALVLVLFLGLIIVTDYLIAKRDRGQ